MPKIGQIGFGKTGKAVASVLLQSKKTNLQWVVRNSRSLEHRSVPEFLGIQSDEPGLIYSREEFTAGELLDKFPVDIIVDFSSNDGIDFYAEEAKKRHITVISAVSEYTPDKVQLISEISLHACVIRSPNITLGINFLIIAAKILKNIAPHTDIEIIEEHFKAKSECSGTARVIAKELDIEESGIKSVRAGGIIGVHEILFGFPYQTVRLKHESISREAFGNGILFAIENLPSEKIGLFTMEDLMLPHFNLNWTEQDYLAQNKKPWWKIW